MSSPPISCGVVSLTLQVLTARPRAKSVSRSAPAKTSASRWVMRTTAAPASERFRREAKRTAVSSGERTAVGSSRMRTSGSPASAPAISMRWRVPTGNASARASAAPSSSPNACARRPTRARRDSADSKNGAAGSRNARLSATLAAPIRRSCCGTRTSPAWRAPFALRYDTGDPPRRISPESAASRPAAIDTSVDFPAPFSPRRAWISPGKTTRSASERACVSPKRFDMRRSSSEGSEEEDEDEDFLEGCVDIGAMEPLKRCPWTSFTHPFEEMARRRRAPLFSDSLSQKFPRGTMSAPALIRCSIAFVSSTTAGGTLAISAAGFHTNEITPLERP